MEMLFSRKLRPQRRCQLTLTKEAALEWCHRALYDKSITYAY